MTRIATLASSDLMLGLIARTQSQVQDLQTQVTTGKRAQTYAGISSEVGQLLDIESRRTLLDRFEHNNDLLATQLDAKQSTVGGIRETVRQFRQALLSTISSGTPLDPNQAGSLQEAAFRAMKNMQDYLNTDFDGRYLFSGSRVRTEPVQIGSSSLASFQSIYDGASVVYPPSRDAQVGRSGTLSAATTGGLTMTGTDTITAANAGAFALLEPGATITISDGASGNDGTYTVVSSDHDRQITISGTLSLGTSTITVNKTLANGVDNTAVISINNWFHGDQITQTHRLDQDRSLSLAVDAADPAFEKAMRAQRIVSGIGRTAGSPLADQRRTRARRLGVGSQQQRCDLHQQRHPGRRLPSSLWSADQYVVVELGRLDRCFCQDRRWSGEVLPRRRQDARRLGRRFLQRGFRIHLQPGGRRRSRRRDQRLQQHQQMGLDRRRLGNPRDLVIQQT